MEVQNLYPKFIQHINAPHSDIAKIYYDEMLRLYIDEFGLPFILDELERAKSGLRNLKVRGGMIEAFKWFVNYYNNYENNPEKNFIGTKQVSVSDYGIYCKGIYWLATYELLTK